MSTSTSKIAALASFVILLGLAGCEVNPIDLYAADASVDSSKTTGAEAGRPLGEDAAPACGPSPITIDYDCGKTDKLTTTCQVGSGLAETPCRFQGGWLVSNCIQCWDLR